MKKFIILLLLLAPAAHAATIYPVPESFFAKVWRCKWHISCYQQKLGATITTIAATDIIRNSRATINTNFANANSELLGVLTPARVTATSTSASSSIAWGLEVYQRAIAIGTTATTTIRATATSSFNGGVSSTGTLDVQSTTATSTFSNGIRLVNGCITMPDGNCALSSGISGSGSVDQVAYFSGSTVLAGDADFTRTATGYVATNGTTTNATSTSLQVSQLASTTQIIVGALGVGVSTTTQRNVQIAGDAQITGVLNVGGDRVGAVKFLTTPTNAVDRTTLTAGTFTDVDITSTTTPDVARFVILNAEIRTSFSTCATGDGSYMRFRVNGSSATANLPRIMVTCSTADRIVVNSASFIVPVDSDEIFEYDASVGPLTGSSPTSGRYIIDIVGFIE